MARATPTSFAVLSFLAMRSWPAYELSREIQRTLRLCWPRTERRIYQEPRNLVAWGWATATTESRNGRRRTVYAITELGRSELRAWLERRPAPALHEFEALMRTGFAEYGSRDALLATLQHAEEDARALLAEAWGRFPHYVEQVGMNPERMHNLMLYAIFLFHYTELVAAWSHYARDEVAARPTEWPNDEVERLLATFTPDQLQRALQVHYAEAARQRPPPAGGGRGKRA